MSKNKKPKKINPKARLVLWQIINVIVLLLPLAILVIIKRNEYFTSKTTLNNLAGLVLIAVLVIIAMSKHADFLKGCWGGLIFFAAVFFLRNIIYDIVFIVGCYEIGSILSTLFPQRMIRKWRRICDKVETAKINADANAEAFGVNQG